MAKFKVKKLFKDVKTGQVIHPDEVVDFTVDRADKLNEK